MTYILGLSHLGVNSIISDARVTSTSGAGRNIALKTGLLFPGCIFGRAGNAASSREFVLATKNALAGKNSVSGFWQQFVDFVGLYDMPKATTDSGGRFRLLISTRCLGKPELFLLDSYTRELTSVKQNWISLGSGKPVLDPLVEQDYGNRIDYVTKAIHAHGAPKHIYPYFICLWLSELTLTFEKHSLQERGVGGAFHFVYQTEYLEAVQNPALYVFCAADVATRRIFIWFYRVCFVQGCLIVERVMPPHQDRDAPLGRHNRFAFCDEASRPDILVQMAKDPRFPDALRKELNGLPFYEFCGFGFANPAHRRGLGFHYTDEGAYVVTPDGEIADAYKALIVNHFE